MYGDNEGITMFGGFKARTLNPHIGTTFISTKLPAMQAGTSAIMASFCKKLNDSSLRLQCLKALAQLVARALEVAQRALRLQGIRP
jgi:hypothetical protein